jgi:hypothetical protein
MNHVTEEQKSSATKALAIVGFLVLIIFAVFAAVQVVRFIPSAFSSLASLADSVYNYKDKEQLTVATKETVVNAGDSFTITWNKLRQSGSYGFSFACQDGVSLEARIGGAILPLTCDESTDLGDVSSLEVRPSSEKERFIDLTYTVTFTPEKDPSATKSQNGKITVVNASIPVTGLAENTAPETDNGTAATTETKPAANPSASKPAKPVYTAGTPMTVTKYIYTLPVSNPKGTTDLAATYLGVGTLIGTTFIPQTRIDRDTVNAVQFQVKNIGTKTSGEWSFTADLPGSGSYESKDQAPLKPNERAVITLEFGELSHSGTEKVSVEIDVKNDAHANNDEFTKTIKVVN